MYVISSLKKHKKILHPVRDRGYGGTTLVYMQTKHIYTLVDNGTSPHTSS